MLLSTFHIASSPPGQSTHDVLSQTIAEIEAAEALGFHTAWLTEHHGSAYGVSSSPTLLAAAIAARTQSIRIGFAVNVIPLHQPFRLAEEIALVDHLSQGRVIAGFGSGYSPVEYELYGADFQNRRTAHQEGLRRIIDFWTQDSSAAKPFQRPHPSVAITASSPGSIKTAARAGHRLLLLGPLPQVRERIDLYRRTLEESGHSAAVKESLSSSIGLLRHIGIGTDEASIRGHVREATRWHLNERDVLAGDAPRTLDDDAIDTYLADTALIGTADEVRRAIAHLSEAGVGEILGYFKWGTLTHQDALETMRRLSDGE